MLAVYTGPMFSGKTSKLINEMTSYADVTGVRPLLINYIGDTRGTLKISSHRSNFAISDKLDVIKCHSLWDELLELSQKYEVIGIDEAQFYPDTLKFVLELLRQGKHIYVAGLDGTYEMASFSNVGSDIKELLRYATVFVKLTAICKDCLDQFGGLMTPSTIESFKAPYTSRITPSKETILVGAADLYLPTCWVHFHDRLK